jgi:hypothetical protein
MVSLNVTSDLAYQAAVLGWMNSPDLFKLLAQIVTSEKSPKSAGVPAALTWTRRCRYRNEHGRNSTAGSDRAARRYDASL